MRLTETVVCLAIIVTLIGALGAYALGKKSYALRAAVQSFSGFLDDARQVAQTSGSGATVAIASDGHGGFIASLYPYRPLSGADLGARPARTLSAGVELTTLAIFISSSGTTSAAAWTPDGGTLASEPSCTTPINLTFSDGVTNETHTIACARAALQ